MSFSAALTVNGKSYVVRRFRWGVRQNTDVMGRPDARIQAGQLQVELDSEPDDVLHHWALDDTNLMDGEITVFAADDGDVRRKRIKFEDAYCIGLSKRFDGSGSNQGMTMTLTLGASTDYWRRFHRQRVAYLTL